MAWTPIISGYVSAYFCQVNPNIHKAERPKEWGRLYLSIKSSHPWQIQHYLNLTILTFSRDLEKNV